MWGQQNHHSQNGICADYITTAVVPDLIQIFHINITYCVSGPIEGMIENGELSVVIDADGNGLIIGDSVATMDGVGVGSAVVVVVKSSNASVPESVTGSGFLNATTISHATRRITATIIIYIQAFFIIHPLNLNYFLIIEY